MIGINKNEGFTNKNKMKRWKKRGKCQKSLSVENAKSLLRKAMLLFVLLAIL